VTVTWGSALKGVHESTRAFRGRTWRARTSLTDYRLDVKDYKRRTGGGEDSGDVALPRVEGIVLKDRSKPGAPGNGGVIDGVPPRDGL
jgi:hypothetical protein